MENLTGEAILKQLRKRYTPSLICTVCLFVIAAVCTGICAYMRGMTDVVTIIAAAVSAVILIMLLIVLFHWIFVTKDKVLQPFGNAIALAGCIRAGGTFAIWQTPPTANTRSSSQKNISSVRRACRVICRSEKSHSYSAGS